jgi:hypothetical protein
MRRVLWLVAAAVVLTVGPLAPAGPAAACSCAELTEQQAFDAAEVVFTGDLVEVRTPPRSGVVSSSDPERFIFVVDRVYKGSAGREQSVVTAMEGASCGLEISGRGPFIVFARRDRPEGVADWVDDELSADLCGGTRVLWATGVPAVFGEGAPPRAGASPFGTPTAPPVSDDSGPLLAIGTIIATGAASLIIWTTRLRRRPPGER